MEQPNNVQFALQDSSLKINLVLLIVDLDFSMIIQSKYVQVVTVPVQHAHL